MKRIQRSRQKGWLMPPETRYVGRGSRFGNPYRLDSYERDYGVEQDGSGATDRGNRLMALSDYAGLVNGRWDAQEETPPHVTPPEIRAELEGWNLACWCRLCERHRDGLPADEVCVECDPCHADWLLRVAAGGCGCPEPDLGVHWRTCPQGYYEPVSREAGPR